MTEEKNEVIFDDDKISKSEEFVNPDELYQELIQCVQKYHPSDDISMIEKAYKVASEAHKNQFRKSGEPYIIHPLNVAIILADLKLDKETIVAGILHDVVEDTEITFEDLTGEFPEEVVEALRYLTRDKSMNYFDYIRNIRKNPIAKKVKQADLLHNSDVTRLSDCENMSTEQISRLHGRYKRALEILHDAR